MKKAFALCTFVLLTVSPIAEGQIPQNLNYQGVLTDASGTVVADGNYNLTFKRYEAATGGTAIWTETQTVAVSNGIFAIDNATNTNAALSGITNSTQRLALGVLGTSVAGP